MLRKIIKKIISYCKNSTIQNVICVLKIFIYLLTAVWGYTLLKQEVICQFMSNLKLQNKSDILSSNYSDSLSLTLDAIEAGLQSVNPTSIIKKSVVVKRNTLSVTDYNGKKIGFDLGEFKSI
jgi:hypothetical protein